MKKREIEEIISLLDASLNAYCNSIVASSTDSLKTYISHEMVRIGTPGITTHYIKQFVNILESDQTKIGHLTLELDEYRVISMARERETIKQDSIFDVIVKEDCIIYGEPGIGKTTALRALWLKFAEIYIHSSNRRSDVLKLIPIFIHSSILEVWLELLSSNRKGPLSILDNEARYNLIEQLLIQGLENDPLLQINIDNHQNSLNRSQISQLISSGKLIVLIDGLNEINTKIPRKDENIAWLARLLKQKNNRVIFATRETGIPLTLKGFKFFQLLPFTKEEAIQFIQNHSEFNQDKSKWFFAKLKHLGGVRFVPFWLKIAVDDFSQKHDLVDLTKRELALALIKRLVLKEVKLLVTRSTEINIQEFQKRFEDVCGHIAFEMFQSFKRSINYNELRRMSSLEIIEALRHGEILIGYESDPDYKYTFVHEILMETFTAKHILTHIDDPQVFSRLQHAASEPISDQIFLLTAEMSQLFPENNNQKIIEGVKEVDLFLAARMTDIALMNRNMKNSLYKEMKEHFKDIDCRYIIYYWLAVSFLNENTLLENLETSDSLQRYTIMVALAYNNSEKAINVLLSKLESSDWEVREEAAIALQYSKSNKIIKPLIEKLEDPKLEVRAAVASSLGELKAVEAVKPLVKHIADDFSVKTKVALALGNIRSEEAIYPLFTEMVKTKNDLGIFPKFAEGLAYFSLDRLVFCIYQEITPEILEEVKEFYTLHFLQYPSKTYNTISKLISIFKEESEKVKWKAAIKFSILDKNKKKDWIKEKSKKRDVNSYNELIDLIVKLKLTHYMQEAEDVLATSLSIDDEVLKIRAIDAVGVLNCTNLTDNIIELLKSTNPDIRKAAATTLGRLRALLAVPFLIKTLEDKEKAVCLESASALGEIGTPEALNYLADLYYSNFFSDEIFGEFQRYELIQAIAKVHSPNVVQILIDAIKQEEKGLAQSHAARKLGELGSKEAEQTLFEVLHSFDTHDNFEDLEPDIIRALGKIGSKKSIPILHKILVKEYWEGKESNESSGLKWRDTNLESLKIASIEALGDLKSEESIDSLIKCLRDEYHQVKLEAVKALSNFKADKIITPLVAKWTDNIHIRKKSLKSLGKISTEGAINALFQALEYDDLTLMFGTLNVLNNLPSIPKLKPLIKILNIQDFKKLVYEDEIDQKVNDLILPADERVKMFKRRIVNLIHDLSQRKKWWIELNNF